MVKKLDLGISLSFYILFFFIPLLVIPVNSELFEFGKIVFLYLMTIVIIFLWLIKIICQKHINLTTTRLAPFLLLFLTFQIISTWLSVDRLSSIFGYYSRFNGGLLSTISYLLLYFAFVSNLNKKQVVRLIYFLQLSSLLVSVYGLLQHYGLDKNIWVQDVQNRVFSTLGQPNWLAAYLAAILPLSLAGLLNTKLGSQKSKFFYILLSIQFLALLFTKSRSGILAFGVAYLIFWVFNLKKHIKPYLLSSVLFLLLSLIVGFPWSPKSRSQPQEITPAISSVVERGGTESGVIRKIVWKGAFDVWKRYPLFGSGVETFAYTFYQDRPKEHNLTSEWNFLYNKAHNEYLNYLSTAGLFGLIAYLSLITYSLLLLKKSPALLAGYASLLITNFFGFSVVVTSLFFFLFPAMALKLNENK